MSQGQGINAHALFSDVFSSVFWMIAIVKRILVNNIKQGYLD